MGSSRPTRADRREIQDIAGMERRATRLEIVCHDLGDFSKIWIYGGISGYRRYLPYREMRSSARYEQSPARSR